MGLRKYVNGFTFMIHPEELKTPLEWRKPRMIFVNSMSDLFHEEMPCGFLEDVFDVMKRADWHIYQILTKRPERMLKFSLEYGVVPDHVWMGVTVEEAALRNRIDLLRKVPCKTRFISFEPLIGPVGKLNLSEISWAIVGGESGPNHRPVKAEWVREIREQCVAQGIAFFFKQWGGPRPKSGGRELDGRIWNEYPRTAPSKPSACSVV
jgi:protein gp37